MKLEFGTGSRFALLKDKNAFRLIDYAIENGIFRFDTAVSYGNGKTQPLLGRALEKHFYENREKFIISSKAGSHNMNLIRQTKNFDPYYIEQMINKSIKDLRCKYLDKFYLHGPSILEIETSGLLNKLKILQNQGKIKEIGVNTHEIEIMKLLASGYYSEINCLMIDYNLIQQNREIIFEKCKRNNIKISTGTALCQGLLLESPFDTFLRKRNFFNIARLIFKKSSRRFIYPAKKVRNYIIREHPHDYKKIPLSFNLNNDYIESVPIGMLSENSIKLNTDIVKEKLNKHLTKSVGKWCLNNCQLNEH